MYARIASVILHFFGCLFFLTVFLGWISLPSDIAVAGGILGLLAMLLYMVYRIRVWLKTPVETKL